MITSRLLASLVRFARGSIPVWTYWLAFLILVGGSAVAFEVSGGQFCSASAMHAVEHAEAATCLDFWLNRYQTFVGGLIAFLAAALAYIGVRQQIGVTRTLQNEQRTREEAAARAMLPLALAEIVGYLTASAREVRRVERDGSAAAELKPFPMLLTRDLQNCLRWAEGPEAIHIWELLNAIQIFQSRYARIFRGMEREQCQIDLCELLTKTERLFPYGRGDNLKPKMTAGEIIHAVSFLKLEPIAGSLLDLYRAAEIEKTSGDLGAVDDIECV